MNSTRSVDKKWQIFGKTDSLLKAEISFWKMFGRKSSRNFSRETFATLFDESWNMSHCLRSTQAMLSGLEFYFADLCHAVVKSLSIFNIPSFEIQNFWKFKFYLRVKIGQKWPFIQSKQFQTKFNVILYILGTV